MIELEEVTKRYGAATALSGVTLRVPAGTVYGLLGPNGAGKTTALKILAGLVHPDSGTARIAGRDLQRQRQAASRRTGYVPDRPLLYERLTGREFLDFVADLYDCPPETLVAAREEVIRRFALEEAIDRRIDGYSHGMRQKLSLAAVLMRDPAAFLIDEPIVGLDPSGVIQLRGLLAELARRGKAVLLSTHSLEVARAACTRLGILHRGKLVAEGTPEDLVARAATATPAPSRRAADPPSLEDAFLVLTGTEETRSPAA